MVFCQSCSMPIDDVKMRGTDADGSQSGEYCVYCYKNGAFTYPEATMEDMIAQCVPHMVSEELDAEAVRAQLREFFPKLKRWQGGA